MPLKQQQTMYTVKSSHTFAVPCDHRAPNCQHGHTQSQKQVHVSKCVRFWIAGSFYTVNSHLNYQHKLNTDYLFLSLHRAFWYSHSSFTNRCTFIKTLIAFYIKIRWLLHVSVYDHLQGACNWAWLKLYWY